MTLFLLFLIALLSLCLGGCIRTILVLKDIGRKQMEEIENLAALTEQFKGLANDFEALWLASLLDDDDEDGDGLELPEEGEDPPLKAMAVGKGIN